MMKSCSRCKDKMPIIRRRWHLLPFFIFPRRLQVHKFKRNGVAMLLCDDCLKYAKKRLTKRGKNNGNTGAL